MARIVSLPGDSARSEREVRTPYTTAAPEQTSATSTPWWARKLDKKILRGRSELERGREQAQPTQREKATTRAGRAEAREVASLACDGSGRPPADPHIRHLELRDRLADRGNLRRGRLLEHRQQRAQRLDREAY